MRAVKFAIIPLLAGMALPQVAVSDIFAYTDADGVRHITNSPNGDKRFKLIIRSRETRPGFRYPNRAGLAGAASSAPLAVRRSEYDEVVRRTANTYQMDAALVRAVIHAESAFNPTAVSPKGASGLMQLMPETASRYGVRDIFNPAENVDAGVRYLRDLKAMFGNNLRLTLAAYNAGENAVLRYGDVPPYPETIDYVSRVMSLHGLYRQTN